ncbi:TusE/DsrC/DsvC family sulfur relay protein [Psychrobacter sp. HD31]|uniref:TusE/DsrC/DsvC family sulfur relay protein n=1 Tax=Psychrobacter sp. HD31 TaxID=3112003 RepID=UPI003DA604C4
MTQTTTDLALDEDGHLLDHTIWSQQIAQILADTIDITLTDEHHAILIVIRNFYAEFNHPPATRPLIKYLQQQLPESEITNQKLQQLFNTGLVARHLNRIAGLPKPPNCL